MFSLETDHGKFLAAEHGGGNEGVTRDGIPTGLAVGNRDTPGHVGDWQTFHLIPSDEPEYFGLSVETDQVEGTRFACAEDAGRLGIVVFNRPSLGDWEKWRVWQRHDGKVAFESKVAPLHFIKVFPDGSVMLARSVANGEPVTEPGGYESFTVHGNLGLRGSRPPMRGDVDRLALPVRADVYGWRDQNGPRPIVLESFFPALYFEKHDPAHVDRVLDMFQADGINGVRAFGYVGGATGWGTHLGDGWRDREVLTMPMRRNGEYLPVWPDARDVVVRFAQKLHSRGMCWDLTAGDLQTVDGAEEDVYRVIFEALQNAGLLDVIALAEVNEGWQNSRRGNDPAHFARLVRPFAAAGIPWGTSAHPPDPAPGYDRHQMEKMALPGSIACYHVQTGTDAQVRHTYNVRHDDEGIGFRRGVASTEHRGPGPDVSSGAVNETGWVALVGVCAVMTGQLFVLHVSQGIRDLPTDHGWESYRPYAQRLTAMTRRLPRARLTGLGHGGHGGHDAESIFTSTRGDGAFYGDKSGVTGEFHRADSAAYDDGQVAALLYGGVGHRRIKSDAVEGVFYDTFGNEYLSGRWNAGDIIDLGDCGDGLLFVGRRV